jgi:hypothetical protein
MFWRGMFYLAAEIMRPMRNVLWLTLVALILGSQTPAQQDTSGKQEARLSIFEKRGSCKAKDGALRKEDLTVLGFTVGLSKMREIEKRFPGAKAAKLAEGEEAEEGICIKNRDGRAAVFATSVMGAPDTLTGIYLSPARLVELRKLRCTVVDSPSHEFSTESGIHVDMSLESLSQLVKDHVAANDHFCVEYVIPSPQSPLQISKGAETEGHDYTGVEGGAKSGTVEWIKLVGIASD